MNKQKTFTSTFAIGDCVLLDPPKALIVGVHFQAMEGGEVKPFYTVATRDGQRLENIPEADILGRDYKSEEVVRANETKRESLKVTPISEAVGNAMAAGNDDAQMDGHETFGAFGGPLPGEIDAVRAAGRAADEACGIPVEGDKAVEAAPAEPVQAFADTPGIAVDRAVPAEG